MNRRDFLKSCPPALASLLAVGGVPAQSMRKAPPEASFTPEIGNFVRVLAYPDPAQRGTFGTIRAIRPPEALNEHYYPDLPLYEIPTADGWILYCYAFELLLVCKAPYNGAIFTSDYWSGRYARLDFKDGVQFSKHEYHQHEYHQHGGQNAAINPSA